MASPADAMHCRPRPHRRSAAAAPAVTPATVAGRHRTGHARWGPLGSTVATLLVGEDWLPDRPKALVLAGSSLVPDAAGGLVNLLASGIDPWELRKDPRRADPS